jgi:curved DNA-binding protein CbpA
VNYYEELGIPRDATTDEIREAFRLAARLLHPDMQQDPRLKDMAECQMRRIGDVMAVLVDPRSRAQYDASLLNRRRAFLPGRFALAGGPELLQAAVRHWFWVLLGSMILGIGLWFGLTSVPDVPPGYAAAEPAPSSAAPVVSQDAPPAVKKPPVSAPDSARALSPLNDQPAPGPGEPAAEEPAKSVSPAPPEAPPDASPDAPHAPRVESATVPAVGSTAPSAVAPTGPSRFEGQWLFSPGGPEVINPGAYPATYVEFRLRLQGGMLTGDYRAHHKVLDKAISPEVAFRVRGESPLADTAKLHWESSFGARGEVELTLRSPNQMQVTWWTTQFGTLEALGSGTAMLVRLKTP